MSDPDYTLDLWGELKRSVADTGRLLRPLIKFCFGLVILFILFFLFHTALGPMPNGNVAPAHSAWMQAARQIGQMMFVYSTDHDGNYPDGDSSTEVFQKMLDGGYISDPTIFYIPLPGKIKPVAGQKLKPENVCWDVTSGVDSHAPDVLPLLFLTGYKVTYVAGGVAVPIIKPYPQFGITWSQWWQHGGRLWPSAGIAVFYKGNNTVFLRLDSSQNPDGTYTKHPDGIISNFVPPDFDPKGKTYRQLTPDGPLPQ